VKVILRPEAVADLGLARDYYRIGGGESAERFLALVERELSQLALHLPAPRRLRRRGDGVFRNRRGEPPGGVEAAEALILIGADGAICCRKILLPEPVSS